MIRPSLCYRTLGAIRSNYLWQRALVACGGALGWAPRRSFLVLGAARTGSTLLVDYLNCHPAIRCRGEILNCGHGYYGQPQTMDRQRLRLHVAAYFVQRPAILAGAKILTYHLDELDISLADFIELLGNLQVVVLYRRNLLEQYVSLKIAEQTNVWHSDGPPGRDAINIDWAEFVAYAQRERRMWASSLADLSGRAAWHTVSYDELVNSRRRTMDGVFRFLGVETCRVFSRLAKRNPEPLEKKISNYREVIPSPEAVRQVAFLTLSDPHGAAPLRQTG